MLRHENLRSPTPLELGHGSFAEVQRDARNLITRTRRSGNKAVLSPTALSEEPRAADYWIQRTARTSAAAFVGRGPNELTSVHERQPGHDIRGHAPCGLEADDAGSNGGRAPSCILKRSLNAVTMAGSHSSTEAATASVASIKSVSQTVLRSVHGKAERPISGSDTRRMGECQKGRPEGSGGKPH
jgi:hypothetical protein